MKNSIFKSRSLLLITNSHFLIGLILLLSAPTWSQDEAPQPILEIGKGVLQAETGYAKFTPNGNMIVTSFEGNLFWDANTGELLRSEQGGRPIAFSLDGEKILVTQGKTIELRVIETGKILNTLQSPEYMLSAAISPDNSTILVGLGNGKAYLFDVQTGLDFWNITWVDDRVNAVQFSANDDFFIVGGNNEWISSGIGIFSRTTLEPIQYLNAMGNWFDGAALSQDDTTILVWGLSFGAYLYDVETGQRIVEYVNVGCINGAISPDSRMVILEFTFNTEDHLNQAKLCDAKTGEVLRTLEYDGYYWGSVDFSPDGTKVLTTGGGRVMVWDISDLTEPAGVAEWEKY